jgi:hypothetical protein
MLKQLLHHEVIYLSLYNKLAATQLKDLTSTDLMKLGQLTFVDGNSITQLDQLKNIQVHSNNLVTPGAEVFADSLKLSSQTANNNSKTFKPSTIYDTETYADTYLIQILGISATASGGDTANIAIGLTDGAANLVLLKPTDVTAAGPLSFEPPSPLYVNESNYLTLTNTASVDSVITVYCAIVARGGAQ